MVDDVEDPFETAVIEVDQEIAVAIDDVVATSTISGDQFNGCSSKAVLGYTAAHLLDGDDVGVVPTVGMKFQSTEEVYEFYRRYAFQEGFPIRVGSTKKGAGGKIRYYNLECSRAGNRASKSNDPSNLRSTGQTGCQARIRVVSDVLGVWRVNTVKLEHNHMHSSTKSRLYACNCRLDPVVKRQLDMNDRVGIRVCKTFEAVSINAGGYENVTYNERDCRNYVSRARQLRLGDGDVAALLAYFRRMQTQCPGFYFDFDIDTDGRLRHVF